MTVYTLATISNLLLSIPEYLAVRSAALSFIPLDSGTARLVASYGIGLGLVLDFLWTLLIFQGILAIVSLALIGSALIEKGWRWLYVLAGVIVTAFVGYWIGSKFLLTLNWISLLQNSGIDSSIIYTELFWFGLGTSVCYVIMILVLRRSYDSLVLTKSASRTSLA